ncbi:MAG: hypothetical protein HOC20_04770 [Chloroflexi bacterium]|nr:hypothetical protein [Chloroflexota bacterium]
MPDIIDRKFRDWTEGKSPQAARIAVFEKIRDIPYAIIPRLISADNYTEILSIGKGSCTPKHLLLASMYEKLGITVVLAVYPFKWANVEIEFPPSLRARVDTLPDDHHLACKAEIEGKLVLVDATVDLPLEKLGLPVNIEWDGISDMVLPVEPTGKEQLYHPSEAQYISNVSIDDAHLLFFNELNLWLGKFRDSFSEIE